MTDTLWRVEGQTMTIHRETFSEDVGSKLLLLASMLAVFGVIALILMPLGAAFAPAGPAPAAATAPASPAAEGAVPATEATAPTTESPAPSTEAAAAAAAPAGPPPVIGAIFPGLIMLVVAAILAALSGLLLGHAKARAEEAQATDPATPH
jgi:hypothetical protein